MQYEQGGFKKFSTINMGTGLKMLNRHVKKFTNKRFLK